MPRPMMLLILLFAVSTTVAVADEDCPLDSAVHVDVREYSPLAFVQLISAQSCGHVFVEEAIDNWVRAEDLPGLVELIDSTESSRSVALTVSSYLDNGQSTVGQEAQYILLGLRHGTYPPSLNSTRHYLETKDEILDWLRSSHPELFSAVD